MKLGGEAFVDDIAPLLLDPSAGVSAQARRSLTPHAAILGASRIRAMYETSDEHARANLVRLMRVLPKWDAIVLLLVATRDRNEKIATIARDLVGRWNRFYNRSAIAPSRDQLDAAVAALRSASIEANLREQIRFALDGVIPR